MISILVCSVNPDLYWQFKESVERTIGVSYELLCYDNRVHKKGLSEVYNILATQAKYETLCFLHEDVVFTTSDWGNVLLRIFSQGEIGVVGVAGSKYKSAFFSGWFTGLKQFDCANIVHKFIKYEEKIYLNPTPGTQMQEVVCLDGVFIACQKDIWSSIRFDEINLRGFHFYDIDFSLRAAQVCMVIVSYEIDITHITAGGDFGNKWVETLIAYHKQHRHLFPFTKGEYISNEKELFIVKSNLNFLKMHIISFKNRLRWVLLQKLYIYPKLYYDIIKFFIYKPLRLRVIHNIFKSK